MVHSILHSWKKKADRALSSGNMAAAFRHCVAAAERMDRAAQFELGVAYLQGRLIPYNGVAAWFWLRKAAEQGHSEAMAYLAWLALRGVGNQSGTARLYDCKAPTVEVDCALEWAKRSAEAGSTTGKVFWAAMVADQTPPSERTTNISDLLSEAMDHGNTLSCLIKAKLLLQEPKCSAVHVTALLRSSAAGGSVAAKYLAGVAEERGWGCQRNFETALLLYRQAAEIGLVSGQRRLGLLLLHGYGNKLDGESWLRRAALNGDAISALHVCALYAGCHNSPVNYVEATYWLTRSAEAGETTALGIMGVAYSTGMGVAEDFNEAESWFARARAQTPLSRETDPADILPPPCGLTDRPVDVLSWFKPSAEGGDSKAAYRMGLCLMLGVGCKSDPVEAVSWLRVAAEHVGSAQLLLGQCLLQGLGCIRDTVEAESFLEMAADNGIPDAQVALGEFFINGYGGKPKIRRAVQLFRSGAELGHVGSMYALGLVGSLHPGTVPIPEVKRCLTMAAQAGHKDARERLSQLCAV